MQLYLLRSTELRMMILPQKIGGQHVMQFTSEEGDLRPLFRINARENKWYISENKNVQIRGNGIAVGDTYREFELKENYLYYLRRDNQENMILLIEPDKDDRKYYMHYKVPAGGIIDVGQAAFNQIQFLHPFINETRHLRISYTDNGRIFVADCEENIEEHRKNRAYLNRKRIDEKCNARIGDTIFLLGLKIVLGKDFIAINNPEHCVKVALEPKSSVLFTPCMDEDEYEYLNVKKDVFSSAPRARREVIHRQFKVEQPPEGLQESDTPWIVMLGPSITMAMGSVFSSVITINNILASSGSISSALPSLITSIVMVMGSAVWPIIGRRVQHRSQVRKAVIASDDYEDYLIQLQKDIEFAVAQQKEILEENNPLLQSCIDTIVQARANLWERSQRHKDFMDIMIGRGDLLLDADFSYPERGYHSEISQSAKDMYQLVAHPHYVKDVPITIPLKGAGIVGVIGDREKVISFGKAILLELTAMHNYEDLKIIFIYNEKEREEWNFVKWIPHLWNDERTIRYLANDPDEIRILSDYITNIRSVQNYGNKNDVAGPHYLIFAADKVLAERAQAIKELYQSPDNSNMTMIAMYDERQHLPKACSYVVDLLHDSDVRKNPEKYKNVAATLSDYNDITGQSIICHETIGFDSNPEDIFIRMSNIHLDSSTSTRKLPSQYTFMEMLEVGKPEHLDLLRRWRENNTVETLNAPLGIDADGYYIGLDIHEKAHGPHGVIAGMTGSGKSELIISYIASMAVQYSPEDVAFVLIDFKGGGMADIFKDLPHTAGLITNLDGNELKRSFLAIEHELEKRQKLFKEISDKKKISNIDIYKYQKLRQTDSTLKPLPHLILISDEFAELKQQHKDFMNQLIRIARIGRSLGVHLILATQKPDGVVDDQIKSNIRFKICLKVQDKADSQGMIGRPDATLITKAGRFYLQVGNDEVFEYGQSPWSGAFYEPMDHVKKNLCDYIEVLNEQGMVLCKESLPKAQRAADIPEKQIDAIVQFISQTAEQNHMHAEKLWLNPLPAPKATKKKTTIYDTEIRPFVLNPTVGQYDDLMDQKHLPLTIPFTTEGNALLYGMNGSGKLEFLNCMLVSLMKNHTPEEFAVYLCDCDSGSLAAFEDSPYTKVMVGVGDRAGIEKVLDDIAYQLAERRELMRKFSGDYQTYVKTSGNTVPNLLLVIHNYQNLTDSYSDARQRIMEIAREGTKYGIYLIMTCTTANSVPYSMKPLFKNQYTLRQTSEDEYREIVGKTEGIVPENYRGRGLVRINGVVCEFQTDIVFEESENTYEAIQQFCDALTAEYAEKPETPVEQPLEESQRTQDDEKLREQNTPKEFSVPDKRRASATDVKKTITRKSIPQEDFVLSALPLAYHKRSGELLTFDLTQSAKTIIVYDDVHIRQRDSLVKAVCRTNRVSAAWSAGMDNLEEQIENLWDEMLERSRIGGAEKQAGRPVPDFEPIVILVHEPSAITDILPEMQRVHMCSMIQKLTPAYHIFFIIFENMKNFNILTQQKCLSGAIPFSQGIALTADATAHVLFEEEVDFSGNARTPYGFLVQNGNAVLGEINEV